MRIPAAALCVLARCAVTADAELVVYQNTNPDFGRMDIFDANGGDTIFGQSLDITRDAHNQPMIGQTPVSSLFFMHTRGYIGDFIWMGMGRLTTTARSIDGTPIPDPWANKLIDYYGPQGFTNGDTIDGSANFVDGWRTIHGVNHLTGTPGIFTVGEVFSVGVRFELDDGTHYGFARFARDFQVRNGQVRVDITPVEWGYETVAGVGAGVVPSPGTLAVASLGMLSGVRRRRA